MSENDMAGGSETPEPPPQPSTLDELMQFNENAMPVIEWAEGQKFSLIARGWAPHAGDAYALELLIGVTRIQFAVAMKVATS